RWWRPDLVVWEPTTYAGAIAAEACGAAHARLTWGVDFHGAAREHHVRLRDEVPGREDPLRDWMSRWSDAVGSAHREESAQGHFTIDQLPESLRVPTGLDQVGMRYVPFNGPAVVPRWLRADPERPRVA
ncbi:glycosyl transferase family 28, partial [Nocardiopsis sp. MG754419]